MKTRTITQVKKFKIKFEKFDDWVYVKCSDRKEPYLLTRKHFDMMEAKHAKNKKGPYNWLLKLSWGDIHVALSTDYLKQYLEESGGYYTPNYQTWIVDPLPLLRANVKDRYYQAGMGDGYLHLNGKPVRCPFVIELNEYHSQQKVLKKLLKMPKILKAEIRGIPHYNQEPGEEIPLIYIVYLPSVREFNRFIVENKSRLGAKWDIIPRLGIDKFKRPY